MTDPTRVTTLSLRAENDISFEQVSLNRLALEGGRLKTLVGSRGSLR
jgi:hypothetical protein